MTVLPGRVRLVALTVGLASIALGLVGATGPAPPAGAGNDLLETGRSLYLTGCASCHGAEGGGVGVNTEDEEFRGPALLDTGEAGAFYYLSTGRMPLANTGEQPMRKEPAYSPEEIEALVAFVAALGEGGEPLPDLDLDDVDVAEGGVVYRANCQACHSAFGSGGALSYGRAAPNLRESGPLEVAAAVRAGPGQMPAFGGDVIGEEELADVVAYVEYLQAPADPGGLPIGRNGPVPEGFVAWLFGIGGLLLVVFWIGGRDPGRTRERIGEAGSAMVDR